MSPCRAAVSRPLSWLSLMSKCSTVALPSPELSVGAGSWLLSFSGAEPLEPNLGMKEPNPAPSIKKPAWPLHTLLVTWLSHRNRGGIVGPRKSGAESLVPRQKLRAFSTGHFWIPGTCHSSQRVYCHEFVTVQPPSPRECV